MNVSDVVAQVRLKDVSVSLSSRNGSGGDVKLEHLEVHVYIVPINDLHNSLLEGCHPGECCDLTQGLSVSSFFQRLSVSSFFLGRSVSSFFQ